MLESLRDFIVTAVADYGYLAIFALMLLESACIPIPSEVTMLVGGALTTTAFAGAGHELSLFWVTFWGVAGNVVGSWLAYWAGAASGRDLVDRHGRWVLIRPHDVDRADEWFDRRGDLTVFLTRMMPVIRTFISLPAGMAKMPFGRFTAYTIAGCIPWTFALAWLGARLGARWHTVEELLRPVSWLIVIAVAGIAAVFVLRRWRLVRREYAELDMAREQDEVPPV